MVGRNLSIFSSNAVADNPASAGFTLKFNAIQHRFDLQPLTTNTQVR
jgi:hypothetical protein